MRQPKFKYAYMAFIENQRSPKDLDSCRVGDLFTCEASAIRAAQNTFGYKSGRFPTVRTFKIRVSRRQFQELNATPIAS